MKLAKIIATIGPASSNVSTLIDMIDAGMNVCRINASFGDHKEHEEMIQNIREASNTTGKAIAILLDLQGPKIRVGKLAKDIPIKKGDTVVLSGYNKEELGKIPTTYESIASDVKIGDKILLADGKVILQAIKINRDRREIICEVLEGNIISSGKGINLPYTKISLPALTKKDIDDVKFAATHDIDYISLSFVRNPEDILELKNVLRQLGRGDIPIISKIEKPEAVDRIEEIINLSDGIMVARGDLADEISYAKVPIVQKQIVKEANKKGKITIIATEMLSSVIYNTLPTRAEASDVANGILDGADALMLSNETTIGRHPIAAVKIMSNIIEATEKELENESFFKKLELPEVNRSDEAICYAAANLSYELENDSLMIFTRSGASVKILAKYRPKCTIFAATYNKKTFNKLALYHGVYPVLLKEEKFNPLDPNEFIHLLIQELKDKQLIKKDNEFIIISGYLYKNGWQTNSIQIYKRDMI